MKKQGFSLVELLVSAAIFGVLLTALSSLFVSSKNANQTNTELANEQQEAQVVMQLLKYEIGLAGFRGVDSGFDDPDRNFSTSGSSNLDPSTIEEISNGIRVRYYENRQYGSYANSSPVLRIVTYDISQGYLRRTDSGGTDGGGVQNIIPASSLAVSSFLNKEGDSISSLPSDLAELAGLTLTITLDDQTYPVSIGFQNLQQ